MMHPTATPAAEEVSRLRESLTSNLRDFSEELILGAQLGTRLNNLLSPSSYKMWLPEGNQNLRAFAEAFLVGIVTPTAQRQGLDYLFRLEGRAAPVVPSFNGQLWKAFCSLNPKNEIRLGDDPELYLSFAGAVGKDADKTIAPMSVSEHRELCEKFVALLEQTERASPQLRGIAQNYSDTSYPVWVAALKAQPGLFKEWGQFRVGAITELFEARVHEATSDEAARKRLVVAFKDDYERQRKIRPGAPLQSADSVPMVAPVAKSADVSQREVLGKALAELDDAQLAKILVPLDVVAALLSQRKH